MHVIQRYRFISLGSASLFTVHSPFAVSELHYVTADAKPTFCTAASHHKCLISENLSDFYCEAHTENCMYLSLLLQTVTVHEKSIYTFSTFRKHISFIYCRK